MTIEQVVKYVMTTPLNTNPVILTQMLERLIRDNQNQPSTEVIYDGGVLR